ncbi:epithelial sodium channel subunit gamma-like [Diadema antillarum]|uniref:epithelial sodium channel subunit gamma-like n=1 Tax=Diadema antillarum TaxID=105358 RepID=UPI003A8C4487
MEAWEKKAAEEEESFFKILHSRLQNSSAHGLPNIQRASRPAVKLAWLALFLTGIGVIMWQVIALFQEYFEYNYVVSLEVKFNRSQEFPAITICNMNPVMKKKLEEMDDSFRELFDVNFEPPRANSAMNMGSSAAGGMSNQNQGEGGMAGGQEPPSGGMPSSQSTTRPPMEGKNDPRATTTGPPAGPQPRRTPGFSDRTTDAAGIAPTTASSKLSRTSSGDTERTTDPLETGNMSTTSFQSVESWKDREKGDFYRKRGSEYLQRRRLMVKLANRTMEDRIQLGHTLEDMLLSCSWRGFQCSPENFTHIFDPQFGNCYTFNSGNNSAVLTTNRPGPNYGLSLELYTQQMEYMDELTEVAGFRLVIHHPVTMPFPSDDGVFVSPGLATAIGVRVLELDRLPHPYGECKEDVLTGIEQNIYHQHYGVKYSMQTCEQSCYQRRVMANCGCADPTFPLPLDGNTTYYPCDIDNDEETKCLQHMERKYEEDELDCECQNACNEISYLPTISSSIWPSDGYEKKLTKRMMDSHEEMNQQMKGPTPSEWTRGNMAKVEVYFEEFNYEYIKQDPAYTIPDLLSAMGGQLGLWLGLSVVTMFEIFEGLWSMMAFLLRGRNRTSPVTTLPAGKKPAPNDSTTIHSTCTPPPPYVSSLPSTVST